MHVILKNQNNNKPTHTQKQGPKSTQKTTLLKNPTKMSRLNKKKKSKKIDKTKSPTRPHNQTLQNQAIVLMYKICHGLLPTKEN